VLSTTTERGIDRTAQECLPNATVHFPASNNARRMLALARDVRRKIVPLAAIQAKPFPARRLHDRHNGGAVMDESMTSDNSQRSAANAWSDIDWLGHKTAMMVMLALWIAYFLALHPFIAPLNRIVVPVLDLPLGIYLATQGSFVMFLIFLILFSRRLARARHR
jgi:putative solute:sodium symporter small subunit